MMGVGLIARLNARPPLSWTVALYNRLAAPLHRRQDRRRAELAAEYQALADTLKAVGHDDTARLLRKHAERLTPPGDSPIS